MTNNIFITGFFGWNRFKWAVTEFVKMYSGEPSFFSYKRFQAGTAFITYQIGSRYALYNFVTGMGDFAIWASIELLICGYTLDKVIKDKKDDTKQAV